MHPLLAVYQWVRGNRSINLETISPVSFSELEFDAFRAQAVENQSVFERLQQGQVQTLALQAVSPSELPWFDTIREYQRFNEFLEFVSRELSWIEEEVLSFDELAESPELGGEGNTGETQRKTNIYAGALMYLRMGYDVYVPNPFETFETVFKCWLMLEPKAACEFFIEQRKWVNLSDADNFNNKALQLLLLVLDTMGKNLQGDIQLQVQSSASLSQSTLIAVKNKWANTLEHSRFEEFGDACSVHGLFPSSIYALYVLIVNQFIAVHGKKYQFLEVLTSIKSLHPSLMEEGSNELEYILIEMLAGIDNALIRKVIIEALESDPINCRNWRTKKYDKQDKANNSLLSIAAGYGNLTLVNQLMQETDENKASSEAIEEALFCALLLKNEAIVSELIGPFGKRPLSRTETYYLLLHAVLEGNNTRVANIFALPEEQQPETYVRNRIFKHAASMSRLPLLASFARGVQFDSKAMGVALISASGAGKLDNLNALLSLSVAHEIPFPAKDIVIAAAENGHRDIIDLFLSVIPKENNDLVGEALLVSVPKVVGDEKCHQLDMVRYLLNFPVPNQPSAASVSKALEAICNIMSRPLSHREQGAEQTLDVMKTLHAFFKLDGVNQPNAQSVGLAFKRAVDKGYWELAEVILDLARENKPNKPSIHVVSKVLGGLIREEKWSLVELTLEYYHHQISQFEEKSLEQIIYSVGEKKRWDILQKIVISPNIAPMHIDSVLSLAHRAKELQFFRVFVELIPRQNRFAIFNDADTLRRLVNINAWTEEKHNEYYIKVVLESLPDQESRYELVTSNIDHSVMDRALRRPMYVKTVLDLLSPENRRQAIVLNYVRSSFRTPLFTTCLKKATTLGPELVNILLEYAVGTDKRLRDAYCYVVDQMATSPEMKKSWQNKLCEFLRNYEPRRSEPRGVAGFFARNFSIAWLIPGTRLTLKELEVLAGLIVEQKTPLMIASRSPVPEESRLALSLG